MIPGVYPFFALPGDLPSQGFQMPAVDHSSASLVQQALLQESLRGFGLNPVVSLVCNPAVGCHVPLSVLPGGIQISPLSSSSCVNPLIVYPTPGQISFPIGVANEAVRGDSDTHTIVRAPVLYKTATTALNADHRRSEDGSKDTEQSPPDRIVASYAAAAHAAALVNHQPVSKAAENFLSASSAPRLRHTKRSRVNASTGLGRFNSSDTSVTVHPDAQSSVPSCSISGSAISNTSNDRRAGWARIVDKNAGTVEYIAPNGVHLHNRTEVYNYFRSTYPSFADGKQYEELTTMCFNFEPTADVPVISDDPPPFSNPTLSHIEPSVESTSTATVNGNSAVTQDSVASGSTVCRISFNPNHTLNDSLSPVKRAKLSSSTLSISSLQSSSASDSFAGITTSGSLSAVNQTTSDPSCTHWHTEFNNPVTSSDELKGITVPSTDVMEPRVLDSSRGHGDPPMDNLSATTLTVGDANCHLASSSFAISPHDVPVEDTVIKMTTETLTTGSTTSCGLPVIPSVVPPSDAGNSVKNDIGLFALSGLKSDANALQLSAAVRSTAANELAILNQLIANSRLAEVQHQQQQIASLLTALSAQSSQNSSCTNLPNIPLLNGHPQINPLLLASNPLWMTPAVAANPSWAEVASATSPVSPVALQQQLLATAAAAAAQHHQQQQQLVLAALLQRQQSTNQQHLLHSAAQVQSYLNAFQRQLFDGSHQ